MGSLRVAVLDRPGQAQLTVGVLIGRDIAGALLTLLLYKLQGGRQTSTQGAPANQGRRRQRPPLLSRELGMRSIPAELAQSALDAAPDAMLIVDGAGEVQFANRQVSALFGYAHDEIIGKPIERLMPERFRSLHVGHRDRYIEAAHTRPMGVGLELFAQRRDGTEFPVEISLSPVEGKVGWLVAAAIRDVTERKRAETELIQARRDRRTRSTACC